MIRSDRHLFLGDWKIASHFVAVPPDTAQTNAFVYIYSTVEMIGLQISLHFMYISKYTTVCRGGCIYIVMKSNIPTVWHCWQNKPIKELARVVLIARWHCVAVIVFYRSDDVWISCTLDNEILLFNMQMFYTAEQITIMSLYGVTVWFFHVHVTRCAFLRQRIFKLITMKNRKALTFYI